MVIAAGEHLLTNDEVTFGGLATDMVWAGGFSWFGTKKPGGSLKTTIGRNGVPDGFVRETLRGSAKRVLPNTLWREVLGAFKDESIEFSVRHGRAFWNWLGEVFEFNSEECELHD